MRRADDSGWTVRSVLESDDTTARHVVETASDLYQARLLHMGFERIGTNLLARRVAASPDAERIHANFARHIETMVRQSARIAPVAWEEALTEFLRRVEGRGVNWFLYGSAALAVRGLDVEPGDIDLNVDDAYLVGRLLDDLLVEPVTETEGWVAARIGRAFHGALIEWMSDPDAATDEPYPHEQGPAAAARLEPVIWRGYRIPVPPLDLQLGVAERRGLKERATTIRRAMDQR